jgi:hypothetical protein
VDLILVADDLLLAASSRVSVAGLGKNADEPEKKGAAHIWVPVQSNDDLVIDGGREIVERHTILCRMQSRAKCPRLSVWGRQWKLKNE